MENINCWESKFEICSYSNRLLDKIDLLNKQVAHKVNINEVKKAIYYARKYHGSQMRQSGEPYYSHPIEVAYMFAEYTAEEIKQYYKTDLIVTSILHDTIEDTTLTEEMILDIFGKQVATQVESLTRVKSYGKVSSAQIIENLLLQKEHEVAVIKLFDRLHNMQTIKAKPPEKIKKIIDETVKIFIFLSMHLDAPLIEKNLVELCQQYSFNLLQKRQITNHYPLFSFQENSLLPFLI